MWEKINSPVVVCLIAIGGLAILQNLSKPRLASEVRGLYTELISIAEEGASDGKKSLAIQQFAAELSKQIKTGFTQGFSSNADVDKDLEFIELKEKISISNFKYVDSPWPGRESFVFKIKNNSDKILKSIKVNFEYYKGGELVYCENKWISEVRLLQPQEEVAISANRQLSRNTKKEELEALKSDKVKIIITSFDVKEVKKSS